MTNLVVRRVVEAARFDREAFLWMLWTDRAGGDAALIVLATQAALSVAAAGLDPVSFVRFFVNGLFFWLIYSGLAWAAGRFLFEGQGQFGGVLRIAGFAFPTRLLILPALLLFPSLLGLLVGSLWFLAIVAHGMKEAMELPLEKGMLAAGAGFVGYLIIGLIFSGLFPY